MKKTKSILLYLFSIILIGFTTSCNDDVVNMDETKSLDTFSKSTSSQSDRLDKFNYFKSQHEAGVDMWAEFYEYAVSVELPEILKGTDYERIRNEVLAVINPDDYVCDSSNIPLSDYINGTISNWTFIDFLYWDFFGYHPQIDAIYFKDPEYKKHEYGVNGEFTNALNRTFKDLKRFWDIDSSNIGMVPMSGKTYEDFDRLVAIEALAFPFQTDEDNEFYAQLVQDVFGTDTYWNYNHPLFSFNAFALSTTDAFIKDRIVMGDGIMTGYDAIGMGDAAPQAILAHEFGHHIQFDNGYFFINAPSDPAEATRRTELMADAYAAYYLTHKRGGTMNWWRVEQFLAAFYNIGDCGFSSPGHHGTYEQRLAAARWGFELADSASPKGKILSSEAFFQLFEAALDDLINCDSCVAQQ